MEKENCFYCGSDNITIEYNEKLNGYQKFCFDCYKRDNMKIE